MRYRAAFFATVATITMGVAAGACSSSHNSSVSVSTGGTSSSTATPQATSTTLPPTSTSGGSRACAASALKIALADFAGAAGTGYYGFNVTNTGTTACVLTGYFGVSIYGTSGKELTGTATREPATLKGQGPTSVSLAPGGKANFTASVGENSPTMCTTIGSFHFIPPNTTTAVTVTVSSSDQGGYCGPAEIEPLQAGTWSP